MNPIDLSIDRSLEFSGKARERSDARDRPIMGVQNTRRECSRELEASEEEISLPRRHRSRNDIGSIDFQIPAFPSAPSPLDRIPSSKRSCFYFALGTRDISLRRTELMAPFRLVSLSLSFSLCDHRPLSSRPQRIARASSPFRLPMFQLFISVT